jgi:hypothetical protein
MPRPLVLLVNRSPLLFGFLSWFAWLGSGAELNADSGRCTNGPSVFPMRRRVYASCV